VFRTFCLVSCWLLLVGGHDLPSPVFFLRSAKSCWLFLFSRFGRSVLCLVGCCSWVATIFFAGIFSCGPQNRAGCSCSLDLVLFMTSVTCRVLACATVFWWILIALQVNRSSNVFHCVRSCSLWNTVLRPGLSRCIASGSLAPRLRSPSNTRTLEASHVSRLSRHAIVRVVRCYCAQKLGSAQAASSGHKPEWPHD